MSMNVILQQVGIIFGYVFVGAIACKCGVLRSKECSMLSRLITTVILPFTILASSDVETEQADLQNMFFAAVLLIVSYLLISWLVALYAKAKKLSSAKKAAYSGLCTYPNSAFIGIPLCVALLGGRAMIYGAAAMVAYNAVFFTYQAFLFKPDTKLSLKTFLTPTNVSTAILIIMMALHLRFPAPVQTVFANVGGMTTPLALMIVGVSLAEGDLLSLLRNKVAIMISVLRNFIVPILFALVLAALPLTAEMQLATLIYMACPCANLTAVYATQYNMEPELCSETILISTLLFIASLPVVLWIGQGLFA